MRVLILILSFFLFLLTLNLGAYLLSEDYRFFLKKIKYREELVYDNEVITDELEKPFIEKKQLSTVVQEESIEQDNTGDGGKNEVTFLDILSGGSLASQEEELPELLQREKNFLALFESFDIQELQSRTSLFGVTREYPDSYYEYYSKDLTLYVFPTRTYSEILDVFVFLEDEGPFSLNQLNNFGQASFYINLDPGYDDKQVRIVLSHGNKAFGLKIKKDSYNTVKEILQNL